MYCTWLVVENGTIVSSFTIPEMPTYCTLLDCVITRFAYRKRYGQRTQCNTLRNLGYTDSQSSGRQTHSVRRTGANYRYEQFVLQSTERRADALILTHYYASRCGSYSTSPRQV